MPMKSAGPRRLALFALALWLGAAVGCGGSSEPKSFPVEGWVVWQDGRDASELEGGSIEFEANGTVAAKATLQSDGTFTLDQPLPPGKYRVRLVQPAGVRTGLDPKFEKFETSGLTLDATSAPQRPKYKVVRHQQ